MDTVLFYFYFSFIAAVRAALRLLCYLLFWLYVLRLEQNDDKMNAEVL